MKKKLIRESDEKEKSKEKRRIRKWNMQKEVKQIRKYEELYYKRKCEDENYQ